MATRPAGYTSAPLAVSVEAAPTAMAHGASAATDTLGDALVEAKIDADTDTDASTLGDCDGLAETEPDGVSEADSDALHEVLWRTPCRLYGVDPGIDPGIDAASAGMMRNRLEE